jgi:transposase
MAAVCLLIPEGNRLLRAEREVSTLPKALRATRAWLLDELRAHGVTGHELSYAVESTATYHYPLVRAWGGLPCIVNPGLAAALKARKTDRLDAYKLAHNHLVGLWPASHLPTEESEILRALTRSRRRLIRYRTRCLNSVGTRLVQWYCPLHGKSPANKLIRAAVEDLQAGRYQASLPEFAQARQVPGIIWDLLVRYYRLVDGIDAEVRWLEKATVARLAGDLADRLQTVPGVGPVTAATWLAEVEPAHRFPSLNHCVAFCGLDPTPQISAGKRVGTHLRLGNSHIRTALIQAARVCLNGRSALAAKFKAIGREPKVVVAITARHLVSLMYKFSLEGGQYDDAKVQRRPTPEQPGQQRHPRYQEGPPAGQHE